MAPIRSIVRALAAVALASVALAGCAAEPAASGTALELVVVVGAPVASDPVLRDAVDDARSVADELDATLTVREGDGAEGLRAEIAAAIDENPAVIIGVGDAVLDEIDAAAASTLDQPFLLLDTLAFEPTANLSAAVFRDYELLYLAGVESALLGDDPVEIAAAGDDAYTRARIARFTQGVQSVDPGAGVAVVPGTFGVTVPGFGSGTDGCDGSTLDSLQKHADVALRDSLAAILSGSPGAVRSYGLAERGVGLLSLDGGSSCGVTQNSEALDAVRRAAADIAEGRIEVTDPRFVD